MSLRRKSSTVQARLSDSVISLVYVGASMKSAKWLDEMQQKVFDVVKAGFGGHTERFCRWERGPSVI